MPEPFLTTYVRRFSDAITLLCGNRRPPEQMILDWMDKTKESYDLQEFAIENGPAWAQGIEIIDAARSLAEQPVEGERHEPSPYVKAVTGVQTMDMIMTAQESIDALRRALEIIAVGDAHNPQLQAAEELIALGFWRDVPEARAFKQPEWLDKAQRILSSYDMASAPDVALMNNGLQALDLLRVMVSASTPAPKPTPITERQRG